MPKAEVEARADSGTTNYTITGELAAVEDAIALIFQNYHPLGYGTHFNKPVQQPDGSWKAYGYRYNSAD